MMCNVLKVSPSGYYKWLKTESQNESPRKQRKAALRKDIAKFFHESYGTYGSPRIHHDLLEAGYTVSQKTVSREMNELGLRATPKEKYKLTTDSNHTYNIYPNLLNQNFEVEKPGQVWVGDITYIWTMEGWLYLATIMDLYSRKIIGWDLDDRMKKELPINALKRAIQFRKPSKKTIHHSDRGSQYCSNDYIEILDKNKMKISMSRKGNPYDNACIESFHATIKKELIYRKRYKTRAEARKSIAHYILGFYNARRKHSTLGYQSPNQFEQVYERLQTQKVS